MLVEVKVSIDASSAPIRAVIADLEDAAEVLSGVEMTLFFKGVARRALRQNLNDIKVAVERAHPGGV